MHRFLTLLIVPLVLAFAACGGGGKSSSGSSSKDGQALYDDAVNGLDQLKSGKIDANLNTVLNLNNQRIDLRENGSFEDGGGTQLPKFNLEIAVDQSAGASQKTAAINTGTEFYVRQNGSSDFQKQTGQSVDQLAGTYESEQEKIGQGRIPLLSLTPGDWAKNPKVAGTETVDGVEVQKITADLDVPAYLKDLETGKNAQIGMGVTLTKDAAKLKEPGADVKTATLTAYVSKDGGKLQQLTTKMEGNEGGGVKVDFDVKLSNLAQPQNIKAPEGV